jgi:hypothetical protein
LYNPDTSKPWAGKQGSPSKPAIIEGRKAQFLQSFGSVSFQTPTAGMLFEKGFHQPDCVVIVAFLFSEPEYDVCSALINVSHHSHLDTLLALIFLIDTNSVHLQ